MKIKTLYGKQFLYLSLLILLLNFNICVQDFIDNINNPNKKYDFGHWVIYEMNVGAFTKEGTFNSAAKKLSDLKSLGIDIVWLMPIYKRDGGLNSPYAPSAYQIPNPIYGSIEDLKNLVSKAHELNMEIWLDWVPSHTANNHPWLELHPDYYTNNLHPFYDDVSQLNYENNELCNRMTQMLKYWIDQTNIDGFRCDFISNPYIPNSYWLSTIPELKKYKNGKTITMLGESDFTDATRLFNTGWDYDYAWWFQETALWNTIGGGSDAENLKNICQKLVNDERYSNLDRMTYLTNHDVNFNHNVKLSNMYGENKYSFTVLIFTLYGMPLIYNGQEIGGEQILNYFSDSKIDWNNFDSKMYNTIRTLSAMKHTINAFKDGKNKNDRGTVKWVKSDNSIVAYIRKNGNSEALVILNLGDKNKFSLNSITKGTYTQWLDSQTIANGVSQKKVTLNENYKFELEKRGYKVYVLDN